VTANTATADSWWLDWFRLTTLWSSVPSTRTYRCAKCDVTETIDAGDSAACWSCGSADTVVDA
jgi:hypothetical protein